ncbi:MAG: lasso peptide biosynthesis B2 protein [Novosphingobium sp.]
MIIGPRSVWHLRGLTLEAALYLLFARVLVAVRPLSRWRQSLGHPGSDNPDSDALVEARRLATHVDRAATHLPGNSLCLPRAIALSRMLRRRGIGHGLVIAVRPPQLRGGSDDLHAWVEVDGGIAIGDLPGPWAIVFSTVPGAA